MFKRSLASLTAVAIASGAVVAPANAMTAKANNDGSCTFKLTDEEARLTGLHSSPKFEKGEAASNKMNSVEPRLVDLREQIKKDKEALNTPNLAEDQKKDLTRKLKENEKKLTFYTNFRDALDACIAGKDYDSDKSGESKKPEGQGKPGGTEKPSDSKKPGESKKPGGTEQPAPPSNDGAGIGVIFAASIAAVLGILAAALPFIKSILPPQLRALLP
ncbi:hypothetical protein CIP101434_02204 [Corynebacterium diphtheriae]|uniref:hypothetical protein n=1 Tax=Corynebacterium diphtheriae TaxID=1717 RepID=UPI0009299182|nr:hypothetical protein [Corynebacterium diphtheriae]OJH97154.1 hypothetical protein BKD78_04925 [Corynebacterium diphtheriae]CAB0522316.1 hypothetical protein CIP101280_01915 [Corynebacterium diphtheriae]CAB0528683.1 hypothetical protein CIP101434_02204 [Corynebacterium diphtheriae]CAB0664659.1 hypothetical protein CIP107567_02036 [Corynebacterium diphtheriae]CAB0913597.1 hypothetical protein FRC0430_01805 [Corynebacterium diphtheriae]